MTTDQFYVQVAEHFLTNYKPGDPARAVFERYAKEEFKWGETRAKKFAEEVEKGRHVEAMNSKGKKRFFLYYCLNCIKDKTLLPVPGENSDQQTNQSTDQQLQL